VRLGAVVVALGLVGIACGSKPAHAGPDVPPATVAPAPAAIATPASPAEGEDFASDARLLFRVAACAGDEPLPANIDAAVVAAHCHWLRPRIDAYRKLYLDVAEAFLTSLRPPAAPRVVVYPFGGGDLVSALTAYPDATEITTLSLEHGGDPRALRHFDRARLEGGLARLRKAIDQLLTLDDSASESLMRVERGGIPGQLAFFLVGLAVQGQEPVSLRYFRLEPGGSVHYLSADEIAREDKARAKKLNTIWNAPDFSEAFSNLELTFRPAGNAAAPLRVHRHIAANLADGPLAQDPAVLRHLEGKGTVSALIKASSYLLWTDDFRSVSDYLLGHASFMLSDSSGIPPWEAAKAGFVQETYGDFGGAFIPAGKKGTEAFRTLWKTQPHRPLAFRFGYSDVNKKPGLLVTRRAS
jgi:hypothetical protein